MIHYKGSDNENRTGYENGTNKNLYFFDIIDYVAAAMGLKYNNLMYINVL